MTPRGDAHRVRQVDIWPLDVPITDPFAVATGTRSMAENVIVRITLRDGTQGFGEAAPFPEVGDENRDSCLTAIRKVAPLLLGEPVASFQRLSDRFANRPSPILPPVAH